MSPAKTPTKRKAPSFGQLKTWLKSHGHSAAKVAKIDITKRLKDEVIKFHQEA